MATAGGSSRRAGGSRGVAGDHAVLARPWGRWIPRDMASSLIRNDESKEAIGAFWQEIRGWFDQKFPEAVLIAEWSLPEIAVRPGSISIS